MINSGQFQDPTPRRDGCAPGCPQPVGGDHLPVCKTETDMEGISTISVSRPGEVEQQIDFRGNRPDGLLIVLEDGRIICYGRRDGYPPASLWIIGPDGEDVLSVPSGGTPQELAAALRRQASRILENAGLDQITGEPRESIRWPQAGLSDTPFGAGEGVEASRG